MTRHPFFISCPRNLESLLLEELREMGVEGGRREYLGVSADLSLEEAYGIVYGSRIASRLLRPLNSFPCRNPGELYARAREFNWDVLLRPGQTFKISATVSGSGITHSQYAALKLKDAVADSLRERRGSRPDVDRENPDVRFDLFLRHDQATLSLYYSDGVLHRRGYRKQSVSAPIKENLAAALIRFAGWRGEGRFCDFFCGSGTFLLEAAMIASRTPAGFFRARQGFENLPDFSPETWERVKGGMEAGIVSPPRGLISGYDISHEAVSAARANLAGTPFADAVAVTQGDFARLEESFPGATVVGNPPYGLRLGQGDAGALHRLYQDFGRFLKARCPGGRACILIPEEALERDIWFKPSKWLFLDNGDLEVKANFYSIRAEGPR